MQKRRWIGFAITLACLAATGNIVHADILFINDGSQVVGTVKGMKDGKWTISTTFSDKDISIDATKVVKVQLDTNFNIRFADGDTLLGTMVVADERNTAETGLGSIDVETSNIVAVWPEGEDSPEVIKEKPKWTLSMEAGVTRKEGNTDSLEARGAINFKRKTVKDLLHFYGRGDYAETDNVRDTNEVVGGIAYELNLSSKWYWYSRMELEYDEFEDLDIRATFATGAGYYWIKKDEHELKTRGGIGYMHESFDDGTDDNRVIADLGLDYRVDVTPYFQFNHSFTYVPDLEELSEYLLKFDTFFLIPFGDSDVWKLKLGMRNEYDSDPNPGVEDLDNTYYANILVNLKLD